MKKEQVKKLITQCKLTRSNDLDLTDLGISKIPMEIFELVHLTSLKLTKNSISNLPSEVRYLKNLEFLTINYNELEYLPVEIGELSNLKSLNLWSNKLKSLPIELSKLTKLESLLLGYNQLNSIPRELYFLFSKLKGLELQSNPFADFPILKDLELIDLMTYFRSESSFFGFIDIPKDLQVAFQQYLNFFTEFVEKTTGEEISFEVERMTKGITIKTYETANLNIETINKMLSQYIDFLRQDLTQIKGNVEQEFLVLKLENEKKHLESHIRFLEFEHKHLNESFHKILDAHLQLSGKAILQLSNKVDEETVLEAIRSEMETIKNDSKALFRKEVAELEILLNDKIGNKGAIKSKYKVIHDLVVGASGSTISTGLVELLKLFM